jgi:hypothetical protein
LLPLNASQLFIIILPGKRVFCQTPTRCEIPPAVNAGSRQAFLVLSLAIAGTARILAHCKIEEES